MKNIKFGTGGFRAIIGEDFTKENAQVICQAVANIIIKKELKKEICIGYDNRFMSENFAVWCSEVFAGNDILVELFDSATSTPVAMYATKVKGNDFGLMITASHNPYIYNGIKVFVKEGKDAGIEDTSEIEREIQNISSVVTVNYAQELGRKIIHANYMQKYVDNIVDLLGLKGMGRNVKAVFDAKNGSTVEEIELLCEKMGLVDYEIINGNRDAFFGFEVPAPNKNNILKLAYKVKENNAQIGFALDADGDRLAVVDEEGNYIDNNEILAVVYYYLVKYCGQKGDAVKNVATSNLIDKVAEQCGFKCHEVPVGFKFVSSGIIDHKAVVGGESSGGLAVNGHIWGKDSLLAIAICLKAMGHMKKSFASILKEVKEFVGGYTKVILDKQYTYSLEDKTFIDKMLFEEKRMPQHRYDFEKVVYTDYVKVYYTNGNWALIRFSGTEPILRIFVEAESEHDAQLMIKDWEKLLNLK